MTEIHSLNLSYLLLAQRLSCECHENASFFLDLDIDVTQLIGKLTLPQLVSLSEINQALIIPNKTTIQIFIEKEKHITTDNTQQWNTLDKPIKQIP